ncbi:MAG: hypothetical protein GC191_09865 [Azospirillum sp.]|nr:hypothetical protein [Azospirillum sp.]
MARAPVKPHSAAPKPEGKAAPRPSSALNFSLPGPTTGVAEFGVHFSHGAPRPGELSQSAQDFILGQIVRRWRFDTRRLRGQKAVLTAGILIQADGTLAGPMHKDAPWNPAAIVPGYDNLLLDRDPAHQLAIDSFLRALRQAQPLELPPDDGKGWPRRMVLRFSVDEL